MKNRELVAAGRPASAPCIVLVQPTLGENIGAAARAMMNFGLSDMRLVKPKGDWPNQKAINTASGAERILQEAKLFATTEDAVADLNGRDIDGRTIRVEISTSRGGGGGRGGRGASDRKT